ncbi:MAG: DUF2911 domain-containing protein [Holophagales bacterium]|nr:DUF2911 domain-containing protein [Holophagales bacterium]
MPRSNILESRLRPSSRAGLPLPSAARILAIAVALAAPAVVSSPALAQQTVSGLPRVSPQAQVAQTVGMTRIEIEYHRPAVNGRQILGALVPYGQVWRAGANENTTISFSHDLTVEGQELAAGTYGLHLLPSESGWTVIFSHDHQAWGSFAYDQSRDALRVEVEGRKAESQERLVYRFEGADNRGATVVLHWDTFEVPFRVEVDTPNHVMAHVQDQLTGLPQFFWQGWNSAAAYCVRSNFYDERCMAWAERSIGMSRQFQNLMTKASLLRLAGSDAEAASLEREALPMGNEQQLNAYGYQLLYQRNDPEAAVAIFRKNVADHPESWNVYDSLGEALGVKGEKQDAIEMYERALSMAPEAQHSRIQGAIAGLTN